MRDIGKARRRPKQRRVKSAGRTTFDQRACWLNDNDAVSSVDSHESPEQDVHNIPECEVLAICRNPISDATRTSLFSRMLSHEEFFGQNAYVCADLWWDLSRLDIAASYQIDSMMATNFRFITERTMPFDLDGPSSTMLHLKAVQETQRAIEDPSRCYSLGTIASVIASIFAAYTRGDDLHCLLHLQGLRAIISNRPGGLSSLRNQSKLLMLISLVEIACLPVVDTAPQIPFPMHLFRLSSSSRPVQPLSAFSQAVDVIWNMDKPYGNLMLVAYDRMINICVETTNEDDAIDFLPAETVKNHIWGFKVWLEKHQFPITSTYSRRFLEWRSTTLATYEELLDFISQDIETQPETNPGSRVLQFTGLDVLKLIILNTWTGYSARQLARIDHARGLEDSSQW